MLKFKELQIPGVFLIEPQVFEDARGYLFESFNLEGYKEVIGEIAFVQENESLSSYGVLRGLHYQIPPFAQSKLVRVIQGEVLDVAVDIRKGSPTFGKHIAVELTSKNKKQLFIPRSFAHGFVVLSKKAIVSYKMDNYYAPEYDKGIRFNDPFLNIDWGLKPEKCIISEKDQNLPFISDAHVF